MKSKIKEILKRQKGITLVALVITIVILIILATVSINAIFGENGLVTKAQEAKEMQEVASILEEMELAKAEAYIKGEGHINEDDLVLR